VWQGKDLFAQEWCKIRRYSDVWQRQDLAWGDRQLENLDPTPTAVDFAPCDWRSTLISYSSGRYAPAAGRLTLNDIRGVRGDNWSEGRLRCRWLAPFGAEEFRTLTVLEAEPLAPNYLGALGDQHGYSLV